jgi:hypothetical protein
MIRRRQPSAGLLTPRNLAGAAVLALLFIAGLVIFWPRPVEAIEVPNVIGLMAGEATGQLADLGLQVDTEYVEGTEATDGTVLGQEPPAGTTVGTASRVLLRIAREVASSEPAEVTVPDVVTMPVDAAVELLDGLGLAYVTERVPRDDVAVGTVVGQDPEAGTVVGPGSSVRLEVADEPAAAANIIAWILSLPPDAPPGPPEFQAYQYLLDRNCPDLAARVSTEGDDLQRLDEETDGLYGGLAAACLAAFHGQPDRWAEADAAFDGLGLPEGCVNVAAYDLLRRLVEGHRSNPTGVFQEADPSEAHAPPCPTISALEPAQGPPGTQVRIRGTNLDQVLKIFVYFRNGDVDDPPAPLDGDSLVFTMGGDADDGQVCVAIVAGDQWEAAGHVFTIVDPMSTPVPSGASTSPDGIGACPPG